MKMSCVNQIAREQSNMVKAREQSKKLNYTDQFKIDHNFNPARDFSLASKFHLKVYFIFATRVHVAQ